MKTKLNRMRWVVVLAAFLLTGLHRASAWYSPSQQRWINRDPLGDEAIVLQASRGRGLIHRDLLRYEVLGNLYGFDHNNPNGYVDKDGRQAGPIPVPVTPTIIIIGGIGIGILICEAVPSCRDAITRAGREVAEGVKELCRAKPRRKKSECDVELARCIADPWQPDRGYGTRKDCRACYNECLNDGKWPSYKCAN